MEELRPIVEYDDSEGNSVSVPWLPQGSGSGRYGSNLQNLAWEIMDFWAWVSALPLQDTGQLDTRVILLKRDKTWNKFTPIRSEVLKLKRACKNVPRTLHPETN